MERQIKYVVFKLEEERVAGGHANCKCFCDKFKKSERVINNKREVLLKILFVVDTSCQEKVPSQNSKTAFHSFDIALCQKKSPDPVAITNNSKVIVTIGMEQSVKTYPKQSTQT